MEDIASRYVRFARDEARGSSPTYEKLALAIAQSEEAINFIADLPPDRQQPNLFLAAIRAVGGVPSSGDHLEEILRRHEPEIRDFMLTRTTQTNEPARCSVLLPLLAKLPPPLALLEVGASSGLCLLPDRYGYDYGRGRLLPSAGVTGATPIFPCRICDDTPLPCALPEIVWRRGLDLSPLDVANKMDMRWLETLVWPDQADRLARLKQAIDIARHDPPLVERGDLLADLSDVVATAPKSATLVIFHTAVLNYVTSLEDREIFADAARDVGDVWISNEAPGVFPTISEGVAIAPKDGMFLLSMDGKPMAWTSPHGQSLHWLR